MPSMIDFDDAQHRFAHTFAAPDASMRIPLAQAVGRVLAAPVAATLDQPPADQSAMDCYAVRHAEVAPAATLRIQQRCYAGDVPLALAPGCATRIFTGSLIPEGADTVIIQEHAREAEGNVAFDAPGRLGTHIRRRGEDARAGQTLIPAGVRLQPAHVGLVAAQGIQAVDVFPVPRVGILTTGDELVPPGQHREPQQIYNSNAPMLAALVSGMGATVAHVEHAGDNRRAIEHALRELRSRCDLIISVGGASVGEKDLVRPTLTSLGASFEIAGVNMRPGKPVALGQLDGMPVVLLPGNPGAALTTFTLLVSPLIRCLQGRAERLPATPSLPVDLDAAPDDARDRFLRVRCDATAQGLPLLATLSHQGSGAMHALVQASGFVRLAAGRPITPGSAVPYYDLAHWLA